MEHTSELLMLTGVVATCADCDDERILMPVEGSAHELCCTGCDAAFVVLPVEPAPKRRASAHSAA